MSQEIGRSFSLTLECGGPKFVERRTNSGDENMLQNTVKFDATVDFDTDELELALNAALMQLAAGNDEILGMHIPADGDDCELGELTFGDNDFTREITNDCICVTGRTIKELAAKLRKAI